MIVSCKILRINRFILLLLILIFFSCQKETELFDDVNKIAQFNKVYKLVLIQSGEEIGFIEPLMEYSIFKVDSLSFQDLESSIARSDKFKEGSYYLNIELNDYLYNNKLDILNKSKSLITENHYTNIYYLYLLSDRQTFVVCKVNP